jgi:hypothetical protein
MSVNSKIKVNSIEAYDPIGPINLPYGATLPVNSKFILSGNHTISGIVTVSSYVGTNININGPLSAATLVGDSTNITSLPVISESKAVTFAMILI